MRVGCGVIGPGYGMSGMGTYLTHRARLHAAQAPRASMMRWGLNTEHHAAPGRFVCFIYNQGGLLLKWYRDTFARADKEAAERAGRDVYDGSSRETPRGSRASSSSRTSPSTGPPEFITITRA